MSISPVYTNDIKTLKLEFASSVSTWKPHKCWRKIQSSGIR